MTDEIECDDIPEKECNARHGCRGCRADIGAPPSVTSPLDNMVKKRACAMDDRQFRALLDLLMCSDPYPVVDTGSGTGEHEIVRLADSEAKRRNFDTWVDAYHGFNTGRLKH